jgi:23S rRNA (uridine2552-2'-O)-methyltransferase
VVAVDIAGMDPIAGAETLAADVFAPDLPELLRGQLRGAADVVLSDMAPSASGHPGADHLRIIGLAEAALDIALAVLAPKGSFVCKVWQGGATRELLTLLKQRFATVRHAKPPASRAESAEVYVVATGFRPDRGEPSR